MNFEERRAKRDALAHIRALAEQLDCLDDKAGALEFETFAVARTEENDIITVINLLEQEGYHFISRDSAAEFIIMNAERFVPAEDE